MVVTGNFDNWLQADGVLAQDAELEPFELVLKVPERQKLIFKFIINGDWVTAGAYKIEHDEHGNSNNYVDADELVAVEEFTKEPTAEPASPLALAPETRAPAETPVAATTTSAAKATGAAEPVAPLKLHEEGEKLTQVLTLDLLYAAVLIPGSSDSAYDHVSQEEVPPDNPRRRTAPEDLTPTNSIEKSGVLSSTTTTVAPKQPPAQCSDAEVATIGPSSRNSSFTGRPLPEELKVPRAHQDTDLPKRGRRDGLISRFRGLFQ